MKIGVDYYPEHWDKALWRADGDLMQQIGVKLVRLAEFAWCRLEPREGEFDFAWLDEAVALFAARGIEVVLCTPTSCPPMWLYEKHPEIVHVEKDGTLTNLGIRSHRCVTNPTFLQYADRITIEMAKHYADNPAVVGWQIDNELEAYFCYCEHCIQKYRAWLQRKYGTIEALNKPTAMWSGAGNIPPGPRSSRPMAACPMPGRTRPTCWISTASARKTSSISATVRRHSCASIVPDGL